jgi:pimeloyl-ACP methyl ester carboxylesterase
MSLGLAFLVVCMSGFGVLYEAHVQRMLTERFEPPGRLINVGSHRLHLYCTGIGDPPVILLSGSGLSHGEWNWGGVQSDLSQNTCVCSYDRAGIAWSDRGPGPPTADQTVEDLFELLNRSGINGPWVVVGHSLGGLHAQHLMNLHPGVVAALVLVDTTPDEVAPGFAKFFKASPLDYIGSSRPIMGLQLFWEDLTNRIPKTDPRWVNRRLFRTARERRTELAEWTGIPKSAEQVGATRVSWGDVPVVVLVAGLYTPSAEWGLTEAEKSEARAANITIQEAIAGRSTNGRLEVVEETGHGIPWERPEAVVAAVSSIIGTLRQKNDG